MKDWFVSWFDSPYYHMLYKHRDNKEALGFLDSIMDVLNPAPKSVILDLACGAGRHAKGLGKRGFQVTGLDLSEENIRKANAFASDNLSFHVHDMRKPFRSDHFDIILNLFTSFGYFEHDEENMQTIAAIADGLHDNGIVVLDYLNISWVKENLACDDQFIIDGVTFQVSRKIEQGFVIKTICVTDRDKTFTFEEKVRDFDLADFKVMFEQNNLSLKNVYGNYSLGAYETKTSDRLIMVAQKEL